MSKFLLTLEATGSREDLEEALELALSQVRDGYIESFDHGDDKSYFYTISTVKDDSEDQVTSNKKPSSIFDFDLSPANC